MKDETPNILVKPRRNFLFPAFCFHRFCFPHVPLAAPYWNRETYASVLRCLVAGAMIEGSDVGKLENSLKEVFSVEAVRSCGSGSLALEIALRALDIRPGDDVIIPAFCCSAVVPPILAVGAVPVFADVGEELNVTAETVEASLNDATRAIIVPHLFGNPAEIERIVELARTRKIHVLDDAAQAMGASINGRRVGVFGDAGVVSFGREKVCSGLGGGAVIVPGKELAERIGNVL